MKTTRSEDTPTVARYLAISFRFSEYSSKGTCCLAFISRTKRKNRQSVDLVLNKPNSMVYFRGSQVCAISMNDERLYTQDANMKLMYTLKSTVVGPKEDCDSHYVL